MSTRRSSIDRRELEQTMAVERAQASVTLDSIDDAVIATDAVGRITTLNRVASELTGWRQADASGRRLADMLHVFSEPTGTRAEDSVEAVLARGTSVEFVDRAALVAADGRHMAVTGRATPVRGAAGELLGVVVAFRDVTAVRQAEHERDLTVGFLSLVNANTHLAALMRSAVVFFQEESGAEAVGIRLREGDDYPYYEVRGFPGEFVLGENRLCAIDEDGSVRRAPDGSAIVECLCGKVISGRTGPPKPFWTPGGSFWTNSTSELFATATEADVETTLRWRCVRAGYESLALIPLRIGDGCLGLLQLNDRGKRRFSAERIATWERLASHLAVAVAKARAEDELRANQRRLQDENRTIALANAILELFARESGWALFDRMLDLLLEQTGSRQGVIGYIDEKGALVCPTFSKLLPTCAVDAERKCLRHPRNVWQGLWTTALVEKRSLLRNDPPSVPEGHIPIEREIVTPILFQGTAIGLFHLANRPEDYTNEDLTWLEAVCQRIAPVFYAWLQRELREGDRRLAEETLRKAYEQLEDADRRKDEFLAVLSHELRNPLAPITSALFILDQVDPSSAQATRARTVMARQVGQLSRLVDDLLDVTRISRNRVDLQRRRLELNDLVRRAIEDERSVFENNGVCLEARLAPGEIFVNADAARLSQVVANLLQNATKFTTRGGSVSVSVAADDERRQAVIRVVDTGVGIGQDVLARLFQPFMQADTTLDRSKGGLGLGLALAKSLVVLHGGEISAHSDGPGTGAEFVVRLPLDEPAVELDSVALDLERTRRRLLIIEDNVDAADTLSEALTLRGHDVMVAYNGVEGLEKARVFAPQVVFCDIGLPGMDGFGVARAFRADDALSRIVLVALSGYALPDDVRRSLEAGFARHLAKPPSLAAIDELLASLPAVAREDGM